MYKFLINFNYIILYYIIFYIFFIIKSNIIFFILYLVKDFGNKLKKYSIKFCLMNQMLKIVFWFIFTKGTKYLYKVLYFKLFLKYLKIFHFFF